MTLRVQSYDDVEGFLGDTSSWLEANEAANSLMLGLCGQMVSHPGWSSARPLVMAVTDGSAPLLAALMTPPHKLVVVEFGRGPAGAASRLVDALVQDHWSPPGVIGPTVAAEAVAHAWASIVGVRAVRPRQLQRRQRVYELREVLLPSTGCGRLRLAGIQDLDLVSRWRFDFTSELGDPHSRQQSDRMALERIENRDVYLWEDEHPVSIAMKTRPTWHGITVSYVYTPPELRGRGYATSCVSGLSRVLLAAGWEFCVLFADVDNPAAVHIYEKIGYRPVCEYQEYEFLAPGS